jgi:hypothetical protein
MADDIRRVVALGASNLTRGFQTVVASARTAWGPDVEIVAAAGHGRAYGSESYFLFRKLPAILESGLWRHLEAAPPARTRALVADVGNEILYGVPVERLLAWVDETIGRLGRYTGDIVVTDLPLASIRKTSRGKFYVFRSVFAPSCHLPLAKVLDRAIRVNDGLAALAEKRGARLFQLKPAWYGVDPIHIRPALWRAAWSEILGVDPPPGRSTLESIRLYRLCPERRWVFDIEQVTPQDGTKLAEGGRIWLF